MDTTLQRELESKPAVRRMLKAQCGGEWERVTMTRPGEFRVWNSVAQADAARARMKSKERVQLKVVMEQPPQPAPRLEPLVVERAEPEPPAPSARKRLTAAERGAPSTARPRVERTATEAEVRALKHVVEQRQDAAITPGTNIVNTVDREARARERAERMVWSSTDDSRPFDWSQVDLTDSAHSFLKRFQQGLPPGISFGYLPDVLALFMDMDMVEDALRHPERVEIRPETFHHGKGYPVLGFHRGDVCTILGLRDPTKPTVIAAYVNPVLEHDRHRVGHTGGGGKKVSDGLPRNPKQLLTRLRGIGCEVNDDGLQDTVPVTYRGSDLGKVSVKPGTARSTTESDWQRCQRKIHALDRRAHAS